MSAKSKKVRILNPVSACERTTMNRARRFVKHGQARWVGDAIEFIEGDYRHKAAVASVEAKAKPKVRIQLAFDDGLAMFEQVAGLPVSGRQNGARRLLTGKKPPVPPLGTRPIIEVSRRRFIAENVTAPVPTFEGVPLVS